MDHEAGGKTTLTLTLVLPALRAALPSRRRREG
jgi:hypothetical protein